MTNAWFFNRSCDDRAVVIRTRAMIPAKIALAHALHFGMRIHQHHSVHSQRA
jgi:hypothetical protein